MRLALFIASLMIALLPSAFAAGGLNYYQVLGVPETATIEEIKKAYRSLSKRYHPDLNPGNTSAEEKFKEIAEAYEVLADSARRAAHDQFLAAGGSGGPLSLTEAVVKSEAIVKDLARFRGLNDVGMVEAALELMELHLPSGDEAGVVLGDIFDRTGRWQAFTQGRHEVTVAVFKAAFVRLKVLEEEHPDTYRHYYELGMRRLRADPETQTRVHGFAETLRTRQTAADWRKVECTLFIR